MKAVEVKFEAIIDKFGSKGEKSGWTYVLVPPEIAAKLQPENKKSFRVKGFLDKLRVDGIALVPMGGGSYILPFNAAIRKATGKIQGDQITIKISVDTKAIPLNADLMECLNDEPDALETFMSYTPSHRNYFSKWIDTAKTEVTKTKRITMTINALLRGWNFSEMLRDGKANK
jgi:hypothetical protein